jgi:beta-glucanase (GH16 family)
MKNIIYRLVLLILALTRIPLSFGQMNIDNQNVTTGEYHYNNEAGINSPANNSSVSYSSDAKIKYQSNGDIRILPGFSVTSLNSSSYFIANTNLSIDNTCTQNLAMKDMSTDLLYIMLPKGCSSVSNSLTKTGWTLESNVSDEFNSLVFNGLKINGKWKKDYQWGNNFNFQWANTETDNSMHSIYYEGSNGFLRLEAANEESTMKNIGYNPDDDDMLGDGRKNKRKNPYTISMISSVNKIPVHGYYEIRCKIPRSRYQIADFWFQSAGNGYYDELDLFETDNGTNWHVSKHFDPTTGGDNMYTSSKEINPRNEFYSDDFHTYAFKWEPDRISIYFDNELVHIFTDNLIQNEMTIFANVSIEEFRGYMTDHIYPNYFDIDYIRVYKPTNSYNPNMVKFSVNGELKDLNNPTVPIDVESNQPVIINANLTESYSSGLDYSVKVDLKNGSTYTNVIPQTYLSSQQSISIHNFDLYNYCKNIHPNNYTIQSGNIYRVTLFAGLGFMEVSDDIHIYVSSCSNDVDFSINGESRENLNPVEINPSYTTPEIILNASNTVSCSNQYWISIQPCYENGTGYSTEVGGWLSQTYIDQLDYFNVRNYFINVHSYNIDFNKYYRLKLATGNGWSEKVIIIHINPIIQYPNYNINGEYRTNFSPINIKYINKIPPINFSLLPSQNNMPNYSISVQECDQNGNDIGSEIVVTPSASYVPRLKSIDLRYIYNSTNPQLFDYDKYYKIRLKIPGTSYQKEVVIYIEPCTCNPAFNVNWNYSSTYKSQNSWPNTVTINEEELEFSSWKANSDYSHDWINISCDNYYKVTFEQCNSSGVPNGTWQINRETSNNDDCTNPDKWCFPRSFGYLNFTDLYEETFSQQLPDNQYYLVTVQTCQGSNASVDKMKIYYNDPNRRMSDDEAIDNLELTEQLQIYPNPSSTIFNISYQFDEESTASILIYNAMGQLVYTNDLNTQKDFMQIRKEEIGAAGVYTCIISVNGKKQKTQKLIITE